MLNNKSLIAYFAILSILCAGFVTGARMMGEQGGYLAGGYMLTPAITHMAMNNASRSFACFAVIQNQFTANLMQYLVIVLVVAFLFHRNELKAIPEFLSEKKENK